MRKIIHNVFILTLLLLASIACSRDMIEREMPDSNVCIPEGQPVTMYIPFGSEDLYGVEIGTKAEAAGIDETRIHDLYVMIFDNTNTDPGSPKRIYNRYFSYDHQKSSLSELAADENECWYVKNKAIGDGDAVKTQGAVKISTLSCADATLVVIANVSNAVMSLDGKDPLDRLRDVIHLEELNGIQVCLQQHVVNRKDLFLMTGTLDSGPGLDGKLHTGDMRWGTLPGNYDENYKVTLKPIDAKVKFRVKVNPTYISAVKPVYWQVCNTPDRCYLDTDYDSGNAPEDILHFDSQQYYFEGTEEEAGETYYTFCFYMLENRQSPNGLATGYFQRELRDKIDTGESGYKGPTGPGSGSFSDHFVENGNWSYAPTYGTYVQFDLVLTLTPEGIEYLGSEDPEGLTIGHALTSDAIFTVHLGDFDNSGSSDSARINNYNTERGHFYTYNITVTNTKSIYTEVTSDNEVQSGQEGFLLLTDSEIINADCHYEYHQISFPYRPDMSQRKFSWYVKTPFGEGGPTISVDEGTGEVTYNGDGLDYLWVKFGLNNHVDGSAPDPGDTDPDAMPWWSEDLGTNVSPFSKKRHKYPGDNHYDPSWKPGSKVAASVACFDPNRDIPDLMDVTQLILYVFWETERETAHRKNSSAPLSAFVADNASPSTTPVLRFTAFIDEYYYEEHPIEHIVDPDLWRQFVNAQPRELHILSDAKQSRDRGSDVILSSHSVIQQSIQTIYNIYAADLHTLWGTEHIDEMRNKSGGWAYWPGDLDQATPSNKSLYGDYNTEVGKWNGRLNSAYIWDLYSSKTETGSDKSQDWSKFLNYNVHNDTPELNTDYQGMAYSCLSRNRDNNGDGKVDRNEVRWYLAACNQLVGMWVGNESLSIGARLYNPAEGQWRAHILSSTDRRVCWAEEGGGATTYSLDYDGSQCWTGMREAAKGESVRCLRNIGTYTDGGTVKDISYSPYSQVIDHYFTKEGPDPTGPYTFYFDRLNPKSIREYSEGELPYTNQFNISNCVYLKFETQSRADNVGDTEEDRFDKLNTVNNPSHNKYPTNETINKEVTALGYNPYCPPGYRFPNHSEMVLMSLYLPNNYFDRDKDDNAYPVYYMPTRTYYDRGFFEKNDSRGMTEADKTREQNKVGWGYSTKDHKPHCASKTEKMQRSRCVRDTEMTGWIDGDIMMTSDKACPGDPQQLSFSFFSSGAAFVSAALKLCYTDGSGIYHEQDIPVQKTPTGLQFQAAQTVTLPTLASLGLDDSALVGANWKFKMTLRNAATSRTFEKSFGITPSHLTRCGISLPSLSDPDKGMPLHVDIGIRNQYATISDVTLHWKAEDGSWQTTVLEDGSSNYGTHSWDVYLKDIIGAAAWSTEENRYKEYQFYVTATCSDGTEYVSETVSNQIVLINVTPNADGAWSTYPSSGEYHQWNDPWWQENLYPWSTPNHANSWYNTLPSGGDNSTCRQRNVISQKLPGHEITNLNFANGDFIEADLDVSQCTFIRTVSGNLGSEPAKSQTVGLDNIFAVAQTESALNWGSRSFLVYYPAHTDGSNNTYGTDKIQVDAVYTSSPNKFGKYQIAELGSTALNMKFDSDGFTWNGNLFDNTSWNNSDYQSVLPTLLGSSTLWVGAVEGKHLTRATYNYIRVVRVKSNAVTPVPRD